jgi:hypothetical protein
MDLKGVVALVTGGNGGITARLWVSARPTKSRSLIDLTR